ncbi:hypothetical protein MHK_009975, partial [Candidatus Magnetomorum sp. HK-1]
NENISIFLYVYECRVLYPEILDDIDNYINNNKHDKTVEKLSSWKIISQYCHPTDNGEYCYQISKRDLKRCFLRGWLEVQMWQRGYDNKQKIYMYNKDCDLMDYQRDFNAMNFFLYGESINFSLDIMHKYHNYLFTKPDKRSLKEKFVDYKKTQTKDTKDWKVFVTPNLSYYYYDNDIRVENKQLDYFPPIKQEMETINFQKKTEPKHMSIANFDSWQTFLNALSIQRGNNMKTQNAQIQKKFVKLKEDTKYDKTIISHNLIEILKKIECGVKISELSEKEQNIIYNSKKESPKICLLLHGIRHNIIRSKIAEHIHIANQQIRKKQLLIDKQDKKFDYKTIKALITYIKEGGIQLMQWSSQLWQPEFVGQVVTAADIPEQHKTFSMKDGEINISCLWTGEYDNQPSNIRVVWKTKIAFDYELWISFINPNTHSIFSEFRLGEEPYGGIEVSSKDLKFDPVKDIWATKLFINFSKNSNIM